MVTFLDESRRHDVHAVSSSHKVIKDIKRKHHFELEKTITQKRYMENSYYLYEKRQIIVDSVCSRDKTFLVVHPEEFKRLLFEGVLTRCNK